MRPFNNQLLIQICGYLIFLVCHINASSDEIAVDYHCGDFLNNTLNDEAMQFVYYFNNEFIRLLSHSFQHEKLFPGDSINFDVIKQSFKDRTNTWLEHDQWWLTVCILSIAGSAIFTLFYILYRCVVCCCGRSKKPVHSDLRYDGCKRVTLHIVFSIFVITNIFAAAVLILCSQYATHSVEQLPDRVSSCVGDLAIYKTNTQRQIDQLLTDDFNKHSQDLLEAFNNTGKDIVRRFKHGISVDVFDELVAQETRANQLRSNEIPQLKRLIKETKDMQSVFSIGLTKMKEEYKQVLENCQPEFTPACSVVSRTISTLEVKSAALEKIELSQELDTLIDKTIQLNFQREVEPIENYFVKLAAKIQEYANTKQDEAKTRIKEASDTVLVVKKDLDTNINNFSFNELRNAADLLKEKSEQYQPFIQYAWYGLLVLSGIIVFIALCFLMGLIYGCCGQRSSYYNEDCCVRSTGSKFYCCGISFALLFMFIFAIFTSAMLLFGANFTNLICDPWKHPSERPDVVSFVDRFFFHDFLAKIGGGETTNDLTLSKIITQCNAGKSFYTIFGMDKKLQLSNGFSDDLEAFLDSMHLPSDFVINISEELRDVSLAASDSVVKSTQAFESFGFAPVEGTSELITESKRFDLETVDQQLRGKIGTKPYAGSPVANVLDLMKDLTPKGKKLTTKIIELSDALKHLNSQINQLNRKPESSFVSLAFNNLIEENSQTRNNAFINATEEHIVSMNKTIVAFEDHVRNSMASQITSCEPIKKILAQSHSVVCVHLIDAFNAIWMSMLVTLVLFVPMIVIATSLSRLYKNVLEYKYTIHEPNSESAFATDDYAVHEARKFSISAPYNGNYGYQQDVYPPPYLNNNLRYR